MILRFMILMRKKIKLKKKKQAFFSIFEYFKVYLAASCICSANKYLTSLPRID